MKEKQPKTDKRTRRAIWLLIAGFSILMSLPFLVPHLGFVALVGFLPLFFLDNLLREKQVRHAFWYYYAAFLLFNILTTFWIWFVSPAGAIAALILNALQMAAVFAIYRAASRFIHRRQKNPVTADALSLAFFTVTWLAWEHIYFDIELSWPWLCLGNAFATTPRLVQWYEVTGAVGGSLWILLSNVLLYLLSVSRTRRERIGYNIAGWCVIFLPIFCSEIRYDSYKESDDPLEVVVLQPNIDPFHKYGVEPQSGLDARLIELMARETTPETRYIVTPETFTYNVDIDHPERNASIQRYKAFLSAHPDASLLLGALTLRRYDATEKPTRSARTAGAGTWIDLYNTALVMDSDTLYGTYVKSKLVPGVEIIPYENALPFLGKIVQKFGGSSNSYGTQAEMEALPGGDGHQLGAMICYESVYGDWSRVATKKGANFLAVMTNDGWWGDTPGYRQHFNYARLRAIENRRDVIQAANTGTSGLINQRGDVLCKTDWWVETTFRGTINANDAITPFVRHGDVVGRWASRCFLILLLGLLVWAAADASGKRSARGRSAAGNA
jgi:apolipoprotein N-acyltransferase